MDSYWQSLTPALQWSSTARRSLGAATYTTSSFPGGPKVQLAQQVTLLEQRNLDLGITACKDCKPSSGNGSRSSRSAALILGGILAVIIVRRMRHLERQAETRYSEVEEARQELRSCRTAWSPPRKRNAVTSRRVARRDRPGHVGNAFGPEQTGGGARR